MRCVFSDKRQSGQTLQRISEYFGILGDKKSFFWSQSIGDLVLCVKGEVDASWGGFAFRRKLDQAG